MVPFGKQQEILRDLSIRLIGEFLVQRFAAPLESENLDATFKGFNEAIRE
jgi:hypothetical protein